jgi:ABC-type uncharacterized transport system substrate-binding protein
MARMTQLSVVVRFHEGANINLLTRALYSLLDEATINREVIVMVQFAEEAALTEVRTLCQGLFAPGSCRVVGVRAAPGEDRRGEGQNFIFDYIDIQGQADRYDAAFQQLVERKADIPVASGPEEALKAALAATKSLPIVMVATDYDPIALGYVSSLARPSGNVTGIFLEQIELAAKRVQLVLNGPA